MEILVTYKPTGIKTHRSSEKRSDWGFVEWLEEKWKLKLFLFQRLDAGTSGLLLIAKSEASAKYWTEKLKHKKVQKTYLFISKGDSPIEREYYATSTISKIKGHWISEGKTVSNLRVSPKFLNHDQNNYNSETHFIHLKSFQDFHLWQAHPKTGKAHQIRLHAQDIGQPILGDSLHGGSPFFRICLHSLAMMDPESNQSWQAPTPLFFENLSLLEDEKLCALLEAYHQRNQLIKQKILSNESFRLSHLEIPDLRIDSYGDHLWIYHYSTNNFTHSNHYNFNKTRNADFNPLELITRFYHHSENRPTWIREMKNRGENPHPSQLQELNHPKTHWEIYENQIKYQLRSDQGLSPGLFLDQRENRLWVKTHSSGKYVLNLFSYTCGFSLNAAVGGALEVVSVDVSNRFLEWGKTNFTINQLDPQKYEFRASGVLEFLHRTVKIKRCFDLIICDPPSFGRTKNSVFNIEKDLSTLSELCFNILNPAGIILLSTNFEKWQWEEFKTIATLKLNKTYYKILDEPLPGLDFIENHHRILKTILIQKLPVN